MLVIITESQLRCIVEDVSNADTVDAVLVGGLDYRASDYPIDKQVGILKNGLGSDKNVKGFRYNAPTSEILDFINKNPKVPIFLFSAGCAKAGELSRSPNVDKDKLFVIEPYAKSERTKQVVNSAVSNGVPSDNVFVGDSPARGAGVVSGAVSSNSATHWGALQQVASMKSGEVKATTGLLGVTPEEKPQVNVGNESKPDDVKKFQSWLDEKHPGWHQKYNKLGNSIQRGYGLFGPNTKRAWSNMAWRKEYLSGQ